LLKKKTLSFVLLIREAETELHTDASAQSYAAILLQRDDEDRSLHPVYYAIGKTTAAKQKYHSFELEVLAIIKALRKFRVYLTEIKFKIVTDCQAFAQTMKETDTCMRVARWALFQLYHRTPEEACVMLTHLAVMRYY